MDPRLEELEAERWNGEPLPFPILLDATGETVDKLGISGLPTLLVVDPEGKVVRGASERLLASKLEDLRRRRAKAAPVDED